MIATSDLVVYNKKLKLIITEIYPGNVYHLPLNVDVFEGNLEAFRIMFPEYKTQEEYDRMNDENYYDDSYLEIQ